MVKVLYRSLTTVPIFDGSPVSSMPTFRNDTRRPFSGDAFCRSTASAANSNRARASSPVGRTKMPCADAPVTFAAKMSSGPG